MSKKVRTSFTPPPLNTTDEIATMARETLQIMLQWMDHKKESVHQVALLMAKMTEPVDASAHKFARVCVACEQSERDGRITTECPCFVVLDNTKETIQSGELDFRAGTWVRQIVKDN